MTASSGPSEMSSQLSCAARWVAALIPPETSLYVPSRAAALIMCCWAAIMSVRTASLLPEVEVISVSTEARFEQAACALPCAVRPPLVVTEVVQPAIANARKPTNPAKVVLDIVLPIGAAETPQCLADLLQSQRGRLRGEWLGSGALQVPVGGTIPPEVAVQSSGPSSPLPDWRILPWRRPT